MGTGNLWLQEETLYTGQLSEPKERKQAGMFCRISHTASQLVMAIFMNYIILSPTCDVVALTYCFFVSGGES